MSLLDARDDLYGLGRVLEDVGDVNFNLLLVQQRNWLQKHHLFLVNADFRCKLLGECID